jgi:hypothetical protein
VLPAAPVVPALPVVPRFPVPPVIVELFFTKTYDPLLKLPTLKAGSAEEDDVTVELIKARRFSGYCGPPAER